MKWTKTFRDALRGLANALREERNLRIHFIAVALVVLLGLYFRIEAWEWCAILLSCGMVISLELLNTALENLTDLVTRERLAQAGRVKDIAAGAVLISAITSFVIGILIFGRHINPGF